MWSVLRRLQGEEYEHEVAKLPAGVVKNMNHIARHECKPNAPPLADHLLTEPYGLGVYSKLVRKLDAEDEQLRQKALVALLCLFGQKQEHVVLSIRHGVIPALLRRLKDPAEKARSLGAQALMWCVGTPLGLQQVLDEERIPALMEAVDDQSPQVAVEALRCLAAMDNAVGENGGTKALIQDGCVKVYIRKASQGPDIVTQHALIALTKVFSVKEAFVSVLDAGAMPALANLLRTRAECDGVVEQACDNIARLCFYQAGKRAAVEFNDKKGVLVEVRPFLKSNSVAVRRAATAAAMSVTIEDGGRRQALNDGVVDSLAELICGGEADPVTNINALKALCNCSENPAARPKLKKCLPRIGELGGDLAGKNDLLRRSAKRATYMINWEPGKPIEPLEP